jgi:bifunctional non-homologous end joining protein LigD
MTDFTIHNAVLRIARQGDIFKPVLGKGIDLSKSLKKLHKITHSLAP